MSEGTNGRVYLVGAGPGDPGLLTVRGRELLERADVVVYDYLVSEALLGHAPEAAERVYVGKRAGHHSWEQEEINTLLVERARRGQTVVRLKGGDPFIFGRGGEEALALVEAGVAFEVVPGVTAGAAAPAYAGIPVTHRDLASSAGFVTGHEGAHKEEGAIDWHALAHWGGTLVFYMGVGNLRKNCARLIENGLDAGTPAAIIRWGTLPRQRTLTGTVATLPDVVKEAGLKPPALIVIGRVVSLRQQLSWFETRPLFGRRIVVTRSRTQVSRFARQLEELGAEVVQAPAIRIEPPEDPAPLRRAVAEAGEFDWVVFTSVNGVDSFFDVLAELDGDARGLTGVRFCAIGPATAERLAGCGVRADAMPPRYTSEALVETLDAEAGLEGARILCPRADIAPPGMVLGLRERGAEVREVTAYRTVAESPDPELVAELFGDRPADWLTFTSSSTVRNFLGGLDSSIIEGSHVRIATIGPVTSGTVREFGLEPDVEAKEHTIAGLIGSLVRKESNQQEK